MAAESARRDAPRQGRIGYALGKHAAAADITDPELPSRDDPLLKLPHVIVAPHIASATVGTRNAMAEICAENLLAGLAGQKLPAWVNPEVVGKARRW